MLIRLPQPPLVAGIPAEVVHTIATSIGSPTDLLNFSLLSKTVYNEVQNDPSIWIRYLDLIGCWNGTSGLKSPKLLSLDQETRLTPIDCMATPVSDPHLAKETFVKVYEIMNPIVTGMLVDNYASFQNMPVLRQYNAPGPQAQLFSNMARFLRLVQVAQPEKYQSMVVRLDTILELFVNTLTRELGIQIDKGDYKQAGTLISALTKLDVENDQITVDPLDSLLQFFIGRYSESFQETTDEKTVGTVFSEGTGVGAVNGFKFNFEGVDTVFGKVETMLNEKMAEIAKIFEGGEEVPVVLKLIETFLGSYLIGGLIDKIVLRAKEIDKRGENFTLEKKQVEGAEESEDITDPHINLMNANSLFFQSVPYIHYKLISTLQAVKYPSGEMGNYVKASCQFVNFYYESYLLEFSELLPKQCHDSLVYMVDLWETNKIEDKNRMQSGILSQVEDTKDHKKDIFSSFTNIFKFKKKDEHETKSDEAKITKMAADLQILMTNVEGIKSLVSVDLAVLVLQHVKNSYDLILGLTRYSTTQELNRTLYQTCSDIFTDMMAILVGRHIQPGFAQALKTLREYSPATFQDKLNAQSAAVTPLNNFIELVKLGDLVVQMVDVFYHRELVDNGIVVSKSHGAYKDFLSMNRCEKSISKFEETLDTYVADGMDISINVIMNEINFAILECDLNETTYSGSVRDRPSDWVIRTLDILGTHFTQLEKSIEKAIMDVFKQEIGDRFVAVLIKLVTKRLMISEVGAIQFITDINALYDFFQKYRVKATVQYFVSFKQISQLYLVDCSEDKRQCKELGRLVVEIGRENGVFSPEEVYQFVTRRKDWQRIKKSVDKIMYGFSPDDCVIM